MAAAPRGYGILFGALRLQLAADQLDRAPGAMKTGRMSGRIPHRVRLLALCSSSCLLAAFSAQGAEILSEKETHPFPGVRILERVTDEPNRIFVAFISLEEKGLQVDATKPTTRFLSVEQWAEENQAVVAVNGDFKRFVEGVPHLYGDAAGGGERWPIEHTGRDPRYSDGWFYGNYGWIAFGPGWVEHNYTREVKRNPKRYNARSGWRPDEVTTEIPEDTRALLSGFSTLVVDGRPIQCDTPTERTCFPDRADMHARHPRTAMGLTEDRKTFILAVVDGRSEISRGMRGTELAALMHDLGAWVAINIDGGASSQMYVQGRGIINTPSSTPHRRVLNHWGVFAVDPESEPGSAP
jgi:hypothetical protein